MQKPIPFLMFSGKAEEAIAFYVSAFPNSQVWEMKKYGPGGGGPEGSVELAKFTLNGQSFRAVDSPVKHNFEFTPSLSFYVPFVDEIALLSTYKILSEGGQILMPLDKYQFSDKYAWFNDKYGISWQLILRK